MTSPLRVDTRVVREKRRVALNEVVGPEDYQACLEGQACLQGPLKVDLVVSLERGEFAVKGSVCGEWEIACVRCNAPSRRPYGATVEASFPPTETALDAGEEVRQALVLAVPMRVTCSPDCKGLCVRCGANKNLRSCECAAA